jgi:enamine deaminase RidA (YjgF/YER057c/UK114 family)
MGIQKKTYRAGPFAKFIAEGTQVGNVLYLSGQVGIDASGKPGPDITQQTKLAYDNIRRVLAEFGATMDNVVDETFFVTDMSEAMSNAEAVFGVREAAYGGKPEVSQTMVQIGALVMPELKVEIKCVAHLD